jgi:hypothetical protein
MKPKKVILFLCFLFSNGHAHCQFKKGQFSVGGMSPIELNSVKDLNQNIIDINPQVQFFILNNVSLGFKTDIKYRCPEGIFKCKTSTNDRSTSSERTIKYGLFARVNKPINSKFYIACDLSFSEVSFNKTFAQVFLSPSGFLSSADSFEKVKTKEKGPKLKFIFGYLISNNIAFEANYGNTAYLTSPKKQWSIDFTIVSLGIQYRIGKNKKPIDEKIN